MPRKSQSTGYALHDRTLVLDNGAYTMKAGFATSEPNLEKDCHIIPNCIARGRDKRIWVGSQLENARDYGEMAFRRPIEKGYLVNWEAEKELWDNSFLEKGAILKCDPSETNLLLTEAPNAPQALQANCDQIVFEQYEFGAYCRCLGPSLNAYNDIAALFQDPSQSSDDRTFPVECLLVIDSGFSHTTVTPLYQGRPLQQAIRRLDIGGKFLVNYLKDLVSIRHYNMLDEAHLMNEVKEEVCFVSEDFARDLERTWKGGGVGDQRKRKIDDGKKDIVVDYALPDYNIHKRGFMRPHNPSATRLKKLSATAGAGGPSEEIMTLGNERFAVPEILFNPTDIGLMQCGIPELVMKSLLALPGGLWPSMLANVVVVGGNAKLEGFIERLTAELRQLAPSECTLRIAKAPDPIKSTWLGGARLASDAAALKRVMVTRQEYQEYGAAWLSRRFANGTG